ncbi:MAG: HlyD family type I secretion periplasmic adaptor subunit [Gammaproteobacteria bacterium]
MIETTPPSEAKPLESQIDNSSTTTQMGFGIETPKRVGLTALVLVFGVFGVWAAVAPLDSASHAGGEVTVRSYTKVIQHLEGGIVDQILVQDGYIVNQGDPLLIMDSTQARADLEIANSQFVALKAREARLQAERDDLERVVYPDIILSGVYDAQEEIASQNEIFEARKNAFEGSIEVLEQRIEQLQSRIVGLKALKESKELLAESYSEELNDVRELLEEGFADKLRLRELERNYASFSGESAELAATISSTQMQIGETRLQILQENMVFRTEVVDLLGQTQTQLKDVQERVNALQDIVNRTVIRSPVDGIVNGMQVHTEGGVISPGTQIAEIVPSSDELIVEASISPLDIDRVAVGQDATIRFPSFSSKTVPTVYGNVISVSADSFVDENTGASFYTTRIQVTPEGMSDLGNLVLVPGMPADVYITTGSRTFLEYLIKPLTNVVANSFNEE